MLNSKWYKRPRIFAQKKTFKLEVGEEGFPSLLSQHFTLTLCASVVQDLFQGLIYPVLLSTLIERLYLCLKHSSPPLPSFVWLPVLITSSERPDGSLRLLGLWLHTCNLQPRVPSTRQMCGDVLAGLSPLRLELPVSLPAKGREQMSSQAGRNK